MTSLDFVSLRVCYLCFPFYILLYDRGRMSAYKNICVSVLFADNTICRNNCIVAHTTVFQKDTVCGDPCVVANDNITFSDTWGTVSYCDFVSIMCVEGIVPPKETVISNLDKVCTTKIVVLVAIEILTNYNFPPPRQFLAQYLQKCKQVH